MQIELLSSALRRKVSSMAELLQRFSVNQSTLSRAIQELERDNLVIRIGRGRSTRYAYVRSSEISSKTSYPIYELNEDGVAEFRAKITLIWPDGYAVVPEKETFLFKAECYSGLPFYLQSMRPEGFLGRLLAKQARVALPVLPTDVKYWHDDHVLLFASSQGEDLSGSIVIGETSITKSLESSNYSYAEPNILNLEALATKVEDGEVPGSSAGGEQPKYTTLLKADNKEDNNSYHGIVKFSSAGSNEVETRWKNLIISEYLALNTIANAGLVASTSKLVIGKQRVFLLIERYDRVGLKGRRNYFSMGAVDHALIGEFDHVRKSAQWLYENKLLSKKDLDEIILISIFGDLIGNTDQHFGNTSLGCNNNKFIITPAYDVLPMWYSPRKSGSLSNELHKVPVILPEYNKYAGKANEMAIEFWQLVAKHKDITQGFREIASENVERFLKLS